MKKMKALNGEEANSGVLTAGSDGPVNPRHSDRTSDDDDSESSSSSSSSSEETKG